jgi:flagellar biosynthesis protein FliR
VKACFTIVLTAMLYAVCPVPEMQLSISGWTRMAITEAAVGLMMGLSVQLVFEGMQLAGQLAGAQLGFSLAAIIDPITNIDTPVLAVFHQTVAMLIFLQLNVHHWLLRGIVRSFDYLPVGTSVVNLLTVRELFRMAAAMWLIGVQIAAPILIATMLLDVAIGFLSKASPQFPALFIGISAKSLIGYAVLAASAVLWPTLLEGQFTNAMGLSERLLHMAH